MNAALPNILTALRLLAVPVLVMVMIADAGEHSAARWWALAVFLAAAATDYFDGFLARRWETVSPFGKLADPIADKALVLTALTLIVVFDGVPWWPLVILVIREVAITWGRLAVAGREVIEASWGGKLKTFLQLSAITFYLIPHAPAWLDQVAWWALMGAVVVAVITAADYSVRIARAQPQEPVA